MQATNTYPLPRLAPNSLIQIPSYPFPLFFIARISAYLFTSSTHIHHFVLVTPPLVHDSYPVIYLPVSRVTPALDVSIIYGCACSDVCYNR